MSKANPIKPITKESYAMPNAQTQPSNHFEVLGRIPKPSAAISSNPIYKSKEARQLIQVLEVDYRSASGSFDLQKIFQQNKFFVSNEISKTRRFNDTPLPLLAGDVPATLMTRESCEAKPRYLLKTCIKIFHF